ncbi:MAG: exopolysaccharide biosynthesis protein [Terricaulis sp.]
MDISPSPEPPRHAAPASELLAELADAFPGEKVSVGELLDRLDSRANGVVLLVLALPMCIPNVPGISTIFGFLMIAPALQLLFGQHKLWAPAQVRAWRVDSQALRRTFNVAIPTLKRVEVLIKPRLSFLTRFPFTIYVGLQTLFMALVLILPIPAGNWPPGITVALTALALLQRDGVLLLATVAACALSTYIAFTVGAAVFSGLLHWVQGLLN